MNLDNDKVPLDEFTTKYLRVIPIQYYFLTNNR